MGFLTVEGEKRRQTLNILGGRRGLHQIRRARELLNLPYSPAAASDGRREVAKAHCLKRSLPVEMPSKICGFEKSGEIH